MYLFSLPDSEDRRKLIYRNEQGLEGALQQGDADQAGYLYGELAASHAMLGDYQLALLYIAKGEQLSGLPNHRDVSLKLVKAKVFKESGDKQRALETVSSIQSSDMYHVLVANILRQEILAK